MSKIKEKNMGKEDLTESEKANYYYKNKIDVAIDSINRICKDIEKDTDKDADIGIDVKNRGYSVPISNEEIYRLREQGYTYDRIVDYFKEKGIKVTKETIRLRCRHIYQEKNEKEPNLRLSKISSKEVFEQREKGMAYSDIVRYFAKNGIEVSASTIRRICKDIYMEKGKEEPATKLKQKRKVPKKINISNEEIYALKEQSYTYEEIVDYFAEKGIEITKACVQKRCNEIYQEKGKIVQRASACIVNGEIKNKGRILQISDEEIFELKELGLSYDKIAKYFSDKGIKVSASGIAVRCQKIYKGKGKEVTRASNKRKQTNSVLKELNEKLDVLLSKKIEAEKLKDEYSEYVEKSISEKEGKEK